MSFYHRLSGWSLTIDYERSLNKKWWMETEMNDSSVLQVHPRRRGILMSCAVRKCEVTWFWSMFLENRGCSARLDLKLKYENAFCFFLFRSDFCFHDREEGWRDEDAPSDRRWSFSFERIIWWHRRFAFDNPSSNRLQRSLKLEDFESKNRICPK